MNYKFTSRCEEDTLELAENIESEKFPGMLICLNGELGSGKTVFVKGFAKALGIEETVTSPTFNLVKEYNESEMPLYHLDVYRLDENDKSIGLSDYLNLDVETTVIDDDDYMCVYLNKSKDEVKTLNEKLSNSDKEISELNESLNKATTLKEAYKKFIAKFHAESSLGKATAGGPKQVANHPISQIFFLAYQREP